MDWKEEIIESVWQHARATSEADPSVWRQDMCGAWIRRDHYGHEASAFGWKIENVTSGAPSIAQNLRPLHVRNRFDVGGNTAHCQITADRVNVAAGEHVNPPRNRSV